MELLVCLTHTGWCCYPRTFTVGSKTKCCKCLGVVALIAPIGFALFGFVTILHCILSLATLPSNWGTLMAMEYGITSFTPAGDFGRGTSVWSVDTAHQKSHSRSTKVDADQDKQDRRNTVKRFTKFRWSQVWIQPVCNVAVVQLSTQYFPQILHTVRIYKALVYNTHHFQHHWLDGPSLHWFRCSCFLQIQMT